MGSLTTYHIDDILIHKSGLIKRIISFYDNSFMWKNPGCIVEDLTTGTLTPYYLRDKLFLASWHIASDLERNAILIMLDKGVY